MTRKTTELELKLIDHVTGQSKGMRTAMAGLSRQMGLLGKAGGGMSRGLDGAARNITGIFAGAAGLAAVSSAISKSITGAMALQAQFGELGIKGDLGAEQVLGISRGLAQASKDSTQSQAALAAGIDAIMGAGLDSSVAVGGIGLIGKTATASGAEVDDLAKTLSALSQNLSVAPGTEMQKAFEALVQSGNDGAFELKDMATYFPQITASAASLGTKGAAGVADLAAALQIARRGAGDASTAANNLSNFLGKLGSKDTIANFKKMGVDVVKELAIVKRDGLSPIEHFMKIIDKKTKGGRVDLLSQLFGDKQVVDFIRPMLTDFDDYIAIRDKASKADGVIERQYDKRMQSAAARMKRFSIAIENTGLEIGAALIEPLAAGADRIARTLSTMSSRVGVLDELGTAWRGFASGLGAGTGGLADLYDLADRSFFGDASTLEADSDRIGRIGITFRKSGRDLAAAIASFNTANGFAAHADAIGAGVKALVEGFGIGGTTALVAGAAALLRVGLAIGRFTLGGTAMRLAAVAWGISALAGSGGQLSAVDWLGVGVGLTAVAGPLLGVAKALAGVGRGAKGLGVLREAASIGAVAAGAVTPGAAPKPSKAGGIGVGRSVSTGLGVLGIASTFSDLDARTEAGAAANGGDRNAALVAVLRENQEASKASAAWLEPYVREMQTWGRGLMGLDRPAAAPAATGSSGSPRTAERASMDALKVQFGPLLDRDGGFGKAVTAADVLDQAGIAAALRTVAADAATTGAAFKAALAITVAPIVDTSSISRAAAAVATLKAGLAGIGAGVASGPVPSTPGSRLGAAGAQAANGVDGHRAAGGPVKAGATYKVNEKGTELLTMGSRSGYITPADKVAGNPVERAMRFQAPRNDSSTGAGGGAPSIAGATMNVTNNYHINGGNGDPKAIAKAIEAKNTEVWTKFERLLARSSQLSIDGRLLG